jgi:hypothetical protein
MAAGGEANFHSQTRCMDDIPRPGSAARPGGASSHTGECPRRMLYPQVHFYQQNSLDR